MKNVTYINAGAGSGKTFTLTGLLADKLSSGEVSPSQVILTTFTELAASEFREKARKRILSEGNIEIAAQMDSIAIGTVHSIALQFIKKFWYLLDYGADIRTISKRDENYYLDRSLARIISETDSEGHLKMQKELDCFRTFRDHFDIVDKQHKANYDFWKDYLTKTVDKMEYYDIDNLQASEEKSIDALRILFDGPSFDDKTKEELLGHLQRYCDYCKTETTNVAKEQLEKIQPVIDKGTAVEIKDFLGLLTCVLKPVGGLKKTENKCPGYAVFIDKMLRLQISSTHLTIMEPFVSAIFSLAKEWRMDLVNFKKKNRLISYDDMELLFLRLITTEQEVQDYIREHYRLIMVDEFQDSNPIQLKIFNKLSELIAEAGGHSYWVGDPKQSIFGFRGTSTELVNAVSEKFKFYDDAEMHAEEGPDGLGTGRLVESWRSRPQLVRLVNETLFEPFKGDGMDPLLIKLDPHYTEDTLEYNPIVHWECDASNETQEAEALAAEVEKLLKSGQLVHKGALNEKPLPITPRDVAILCRENDTVEDIVKCLRNRNIPVSEPEEGLLQRIEIQLVITLLQFLQDPANKHVRADLMRLIGGYSTSEIIKDRIQYVEKNSKDGGMTEDHWQDELVENLLKQSERYKNLSIPEMVRALIYEMNIPLLTSKWGDRNARLQNLSTLQQMADEYNQMCLQMGQGTSISGFINYLKSCELPKTTDNISDTVKVLTYHRSKGLEWPVVILYELDSNDLSQNRFIRRSFMTVNEVSIDNEKDTENPFDKKFYLNFFPSVLKGNSNPSQSLQDKIINLPVYKDMIRKTASETKRLLYVGMTRAKDMLISFGYKNHYDWLINAGIQHPTKANVWGNEKFAPQVVELPKETVNASYDGEPARYKMVEKPKQHTVRGQRYLSPSKISEFKGYSSHWAWKEKGTEMSTKGWGQDYAALGSCIHDIFAVYQPKADNENRNAALRIIEGYGLANHLAGHIEAILRSADWLYEQLQKMFPQAEGDVILREYPFVMTMDSKQTLRGEMDLLWSYSDMNGKHYVLVDYKTFPGVNLQEHTPHYYAQLSAYAEALRNANMDITHTLIYYPVHGVVHELK